MVGAICRLQVWHQLPQVEVVDKLSRNKTLDSFRQQRQVRYWSVYDLQSAGSMSDFFSSGVMNSDLNGVGNTPDDKDRLHSSVNGASKSALSLRRHVGIGSLVHCLSGSLRIAAATSSMSSVWNVDSMQPGDVPRKSDHVLSQGNRAKTCKFRYVKPVGSGRGEVHTEDYSDRRRGIGLSRV